MIDYKYLYNPRLLLPGLLACTCSVAVALSTCSHEDKPFIHEQLMHAWVVHLLCGVCPISEPSVTRSDACWRLFPWRRFRCSLSEMHQPNLLLPFLLCEEQEQPSLLWPFTFTEHPDRCLYRSASSELKAEACNLLQQANNGCLLSFSFQQCLHDDSRFGHK